MKQINQKQAFTLVELIVVITILAILGTIAFISLQGYSAQARDSKRLSDIQNIKKSLELFSLNTGKYPLPDDGEEILYDGEIMWMQGTVGDVVTTNLSRNLNVKPTDPLTEIEYTYSTINSQTKYELLSIYESDLVSYNNLLKQTNAGNANYPKINGNYNGIFVKTTSYYIPTPSIINAELNGIGGTLDDTNITSQIITGGENNLANGQIEEKIDGLLGLTIQAFSGTLDTDNGEDNNGAKEDLANKLILAYSGTTLANNGIYKQIVETTGTDYLISLIDDVVLNSPIYVSSLGGTTTYTCEIQPSYPNATFTIGTPTEVNQAYVQDVSNCGYTCNAGFEGTDCNTESDLITQATCTAADWIWVENDVYIGSTQGSGFCISPRIGDFAGDSTGNGISFNGWGNKTDGNYGGWDSTDITDTGNPYPAAYGQTKRLDSSVGYTCKSLGSSTTDFDTTDNIVGRMKWLTTNKINLIELQDIEWVQNAIPPNSHPIPALYIADCIDGVKDLGTTMTYIHNNDSTNEVTYAEYSTDVTLDTDSVYLSDPIYQNRQKYLTAWTQRTGSHLPSAFAYINNENAGPCIGGGNCDNFSNGSIERGEYQVACEASLLTDANDDTDDEWIWTSAIGYPSGIGWGRFVRTIGSSGCGFQSGNNTGTHYGYLSARFVVRP